MHVAAVVVVSPARHVAHIKSGEWKSIFCVLDILEDFGAGEMKISNVSIYSLGLVGYAWTESLEAQEDREKYSRWNAEGGTRGCVVDGL